MTNREIGEAVAPLAFERLGMTVIAPNISSWKNGQFLRLDVLTYSKFREEVYVVGVDTLEQLEQALLQFHDFFPGHEGKKIYGILAAVDAPDGLRAKVLQEGIYLARIHDGQFELQVPNGFQPRAF